MSRLSLITFTAATLDVFILTACWFAVIVNKHRRTA